MTHVREHWYMLKRGSLYLQFQGRIYNTLLQSALIGIELCCQWDHFKIHQINNFQFVTFKLITSANCNISSKTAWKGLKSGNEKYENLAQKSKDRKRERNERRLSRKNELGDTKNSFNMK